MIIIGAADIQGEGRNVLGKILMEIREKLREEANNK